MDIDRTIVYSLWLVEIALAAITFGAVVAGAASAMEVRLVILAMLPLTAVTAVLHIRLYAVRVCSVIRAATGLEREDGCQLRALP